MRKRATEAINDIGVDIPSVKAPVARLSGGQRQAIAIARSVQSDARILLLDEPLAAMGVREGALVLDLIRRLREAGEVSIIMILHNYVHVFQACDRVNLISDGEIVLDKPTGQTSVEELTEIVVNQHARA
jgi:ABC-type sugar transport system ATPase subunit